ncbi:hypothetical protein, conserved in T. vivax, (fragment), partial [Trypanosoma vivax Y486]
MTLLSCQNSAKPTATYTFEHLAVVCHSTSCDLICTGDSQIKGTSKITAMEFGFCPAQLLIFAVVSGCIASAASQSAESELNDALCEMGSTRRSMEATFAALDHIALKLLDDAKAVDKRVSRLATINLTRGQMDDLKNKASRACGSVHDAANATRAALERLEDFLDRVEQCRYSDCPAELEGGEFRQAIERCSGAGPLNADVEEDVLVTDGDLANLDVWARSNEDEWGRAKGDVAGKALHSSSSYKNAYVALSIEFGAMVKDVAALLATVLSDLQSAVKAIPEASAACDETAKSIVVRSLSECQGVATEDARAHCDRLKKRLREIRVKNGLEGDLLNASVSGDDLISLV